MTASDVRVAHFSTRVFNSRRQQAEDIDRVLWLGYDWVTFTEIAKDRAALRRIAKQRGYRVHAPGRTDTAIAIKKSIIKGGWRTGMIPVITKTGKQLGSTRPFGPKGLAWVSFKHKATGRRIAVSASHYLTGGRVPGKRSIHGRVNHYLLNLQIARTIGAWARTHGKGRRLAFYQGDQNIVDRVADTFFGQPLISCWDELEKWPNTGHGNIDVIARYKRDTKVKVILARAHNDTQVPLHSDHFLIDAVYRISG